MYEKNNGASEPQGLFAKRLVQEMKAKNISVRDLARLTGGVYENIRKITKGLSLPSIFLLQVMCQILALDYSEMLSLHDETKLRKKYGDVALKMSGLDDPSLEPIVNDWKDLNAAQKGAIVSHVQQWAKQNRALQVV